jgi:hypothetical protein
LRRLAGCIDRGLSQVQTAQEEIRPHLETVRAVAATLDPKTGPSEQREASFQALQKALQQDEHPIRQHLAKVMGSFAPGLFVGGDDPDLPRDNLELERWFRQPKGHERRIHGHRHAGVRIVLEGPTLVLALDAHQSHPAPFPASELLPYAHAPPPACQRDALHRRRIMRKARSWKKRPMLLQNLERQYSDSS